MRNSCAKIKQVYGQLDILFCQDFDALYTLYFLHVPFPEPFFEINTFSFSCSLSQFHLISCVESQKFLEVYIYYMLHAPVQNRDFLVLSIKQNEGATFKTPRSHPLVENWSTHMAPRQKTDCNKLVIIQNSLHIHK